MRVAGYLDALGNNAETIELAVEMLLPFYSAGFQFAKAFAPIFGLFAIAWAAFRLVFGQAKLADMIRPVTILLVIGFCLIPVSPSYSGLSQPFGLGPYITYSLSQNFNKIVQGAIDSAQKLITGGQPIPISALGALNKSYADAFKGSPIEPILEDYWGNCTVGVVTMDGYAKEHWRSVGLMGPGGLGLADADTQPAEELLSNLVNAIPQEGTGAEEVHNWFNENIYNQNLYTGISWEELRAYVYPRLASRKFPRGTRGYEIPTREYWEAELTGNSPASGGSQSAYLSLGASGPVELAQDRQIFLSPRDGVYYARHGNTPSDYKPNLFYATDCQEFFYLAHAALREFYLGMQSEYEVPEQGSSMEYFEKFEKTSATFAYMGALRSLYNNSRAKANNEALKNTSSNGLRPETSFFEDVGEGISVGLQGAFHAISSFLLGLNLDQWVLALIGLMALGIAFLLVLFPFFAPFAFISPRGENAIATILKIVLMFQLTLTLSYIVVSMGASIMALVNAFAVSYERNGGLYTNSLAAFTIAINTACLIFPLYAGKLAYMLVFGSQGVTATSGQTVSAGQQAQLGAGAAYIGGKLANKGVGTLKQMQVPPASNRMLSGGVFGPGGAFGPDGAFAPGGGTGPMPPSGSPGTSIVPFGGASANSSFRNSDSSSTTLLLGKPTKELAGPQMKLTPPKDGPGRGPSDGGEV